MIPIPRQEKNNNKKKINAKITALIIGLFDNRELDTNTVLHYHKNQRNKLTIKILISAIDTGKKKV